MQAVDCAVVGAGPAGLACAHRLAMKGHDVVILERKPKSGGLNEYGIATYKTTNNFAQAEVSWLLKIGGIEVRHGVTLGKADAVLAASIFHFAEYTIREAKEHMAARGIEVRL